MVGEMQLTEKSLSCNLRMSVALWRLHVEATPVVTASSRGGFFHSSDVRDSRSLSLLRFDGRTRSLSARFFFV